MKMLARAGASASALLMLCAAAASAQETIAAPAGFVPKQALTVAGPDGKARVVSSAAPLPTATPTPATIVSFQLALAAGVRQQLPSNTLVNGFACKAGATNAADVLIGGATVTTAADGTGSGYPLSAGEAFSLAAGNTNAVYAISSGGAVLFCEGN